MNNVITNLNDLGRGYIYREGYMFQALTFPLNIFDAIVIRNPSDADCFSPKTGFSSNSLEAHIEYINKNHIEKAYIIADNIDFLTLCPSIKHVEIIPSSTADDGFDFSPLYNMPELKTVRCRTAYDEKEDRFGMIDYSKINGILNLTLNISKGDKSYNKIPTLKSLWVSKFKGKNKDLSDLFCSNQLDSLRMVQCGIESLQGIGKSKKMQCLYLYHNRSLKDISELKEVKETLKALRIECCPQITDFFVLNELKNLELLHLSGSNILPNLNFIKNMPNLKTFLFSMLVEDGDLTPCLGLSYVYSNRNRKHYNLKDSQLPKNKYVRGNEDIEIWRRME